MQITLKAARINAGLTQQEAAQKLGINRGTLQNWEKGKSYPDVAGIMAIEHAYSVRYDQIIFCPNKTL